MNIMITDLCPVRAAHNCFDVYTYALLKEAAQMACTVRLKQLLPVPDKKNGEPYKSTHKNHPCTIWAGASRANYDWLMTHGMALAEEYTARYGKVSHCQGVIEHCYETMDQIAFEREDLTPFAQAMDEKYKVPGNAVEAYRRYWKAEKCDKSKFKWAKNPERIPAWWDYSLL